VHLGLLGTTCETPPFNKPTRKVGGRWVPCCWINGQYTLSKLGSSGYVLRPEQIACLLVGARHRRYSGRYF
jgi:hypothetical protein